MINLIKNEIIKISNKRSTLILFIISFIYVLFTNLIYNNNLIDIKYNFNDILINFFNEYESLIIIVISFISSNILIEEYNGTIKQLLIVPYSRTTILLSKIITMIIFLFFYLFYIIILQLLIGFILLDKTNINNIVFGYKISKYFILLVLSKIPLFIFIIINIILLSTIIKNSIFTIIITLSIYIFDPVINNLINKFSILKYFITEHYDLSRFIIDKSHLLTSISINFIYIIIIISFSLIIFKNKDIKNV